MAGLLLAGRWYSTADTKTLLRVLKWALLGVIFSVVLFFLVSGRLAWAFAAVPALLPWIFRLRSVARAAKIFTRMRRAGATGTVGSSDLETQYLRMTLDHETGIMSGEVIAGPYSGRWLDDMNVAEIVSLWQQCSRDDPESARVVETYLDRSYPDWQNTRDNHGASSSNVMDRAQALQILGLNEGATAANIKDAHRRLISGIHPDHGGSDYLAAQINQAKDILLGD